MCSPGIRWFQRVIHKFDEVFARQITEFDKWKHLIPMIK
jgi:hypothetical protein